MVVANTSGNCGAPRPEELLDGDYIPGICGRGVWGRGDTAVADMAVALPWTFACLVVFCLAGPNSMPQTSNFHTFETPRPQTPRLQTKEYVQCKTPFRLPLSGPVTLVV